MIEPSAVEIRPAPAAPLAARRTTPEHPFYVQGEGWKRAGGLATGDRIATLSGEWITIEEVFDTQEWAPVYNLRVADHHTYFVGDETWAFSAWAHNAYTLLNTFVGGRVFQFTDTGGYSADWYVPNQFLNHGVPNQKMKDDVAIDVAQGLGNQVQATVSQFATDWDLLAWNHINKARSGQRRAIEKALGNTAGTDLLTINWIYHQVGTPTVSYHAFMAGGSLVHIPPTKPPGLQMTVAQYDAMKSLHGDLLRVANGQRASAKGIYIHDVRLAQWASLNGFQYANPGIDLKHISTGLRYEVMVLGGWAQHDGATFQSNFWRAITYQ